MTPINLIHSDAARNIHRYYRLDVQPDLFGAWCCIREWGRIGSAGQTRAVPYSKSSKAKIARHRQCRKKERLGYFITSAGRN